MNYADKNNMDAVFYNKVVYSSEGQKFEDYFVKIMELSNPNFRPVRPWGSYGDEANDGFDYTTGTYYQVYAPENITDEDTIRRAIKKVQRDFQRLHEQWNDKCIIRQYFFVVNDKCKGLPPEVTKAILDLPKKDEFKEIRFDSFLVSSLKEIFDSLEENVQCRILSFVPGGEEPEDKEIRKRRAEWDRYYNQIINEFEYCEKETIVGSEPLSTAYIEPFSAPKVVNTDSAFPLLNLLERWYLQEPSGTLLLHGQPGDGKTSFCKKAVYEYRKGRKFTETKGVFWFPLNDSESHIIDGTGIDLERVFHSRKTPSHRLFEFSECEGMLIFLDGYDEVKMLMDNTDVKGFTAFYSYVNELAKEYGIHFVITSRSTAVEKELSTIENAAYRFSPLTFEQQERWVLDPLRKDRQTSGGVDDSEEELTYSNYWKKTLEQICSSEDGNESEKAFHELLQVPFIFRMVMQQGYQFDGSKCNKVNLYEDLFEKTIERRALIGITGVANRKTKEEVLNHYKELAFDIWCYDDSMTPYRGADRDLLLYSYYMEEKGDTACEEKRNRNKNEMIGFIHRSIYQYFLALNLYDDFSDIADDSQKAKAFLSRLGTRFFERDVIDFLSYMIANKLDEGVIGEEQLKLSCRTIFACMIDSQCIFPENDDIRSKESVHLQIRERSNIIFCNGLNIVFCTDCTSEFNQCSGLKKLIEGQKKLRLYIDGDKDNYLDLRNLTLEGVDLQECHFYYVDLSNSNMNRANLSRSSFSSCRMQNISCRLANTDSAAFYYCQMEHSDFAYSWMERVRLEQCHLKYCHFNNCNMCKADDVLYGNHLSFADFTDADFSWAMGTDEFLHIYPSNLPWTTLRGVETPKEYLKKYKVGEVFPKPIGVYPQEDPEDSEYKTPIQWRIWEIRGSRALLISDKVLDIVPFDSNRDAMWENCSLRKWLNEDFIEFAEFTEEEQRRICTTLIDNCTDEDYCEEEKKVCDKFFVLGTEDIERYREVIDRYSISDEIFQTKCTPYSLRHAPGADGWWLRTKGTFTYIHSRYVAKSGTVFSVSDERDPFRGYDWGDLFEKEVRVSEDEYFIGVRPAFWLQLYNE